MTDSLSKIIDSLKQTYPIKNNPEFLKNVSAINRYCLSDKSKAYFLGLFFKSKCPINNIDSKIKSAIRDNIKSNKLDSYFSNEKKYSAPFYTLGIVVFGLGGVFSLFLGIDGISTNKIIPSRAGGVTGFFTTTDTALGKLFFGVAILTGVMWSFYYFLKRKGLEKELMTTESQIDK